MPEQFLVTAYENAAMDVETSFIDVAYSYDEAVRMKEELHQDGYMFVEIDEV